MAQRLLYRQNTWNPIHLIVVDKWHIKKRMGWNLRRLRTEQHLTQEELGGILKPAVSGSHIGGMEAGNGISDDVLSRLCNALSVDVSEFYRDDSTTKALVPYPVETDLDLQIGKIKEDVIRYGLEHKIETIRKIMELLKDKPGTKDKKKKSA